MLNLVEVFDDTNLKSSNYKNGITTKHFDNEIINRNVNQSNNIEVLNLDTVSAITEFSKYGKTCALNMASYKKPGGGVRNGARAQEECLFRCSNLISSISTDFYPLADDSCLYTKEATFFKDKDYNDMEQVKADVITIAAVNLNGVDALKYHYNQLEYIELTLNKIRLMLSIPQKNGVKNLILGAFGCGVFNNDPNFMAEKFRRVLIDEGYSSFYDKVIFAIINDHNSVGNNYSIFSDKFK